MHKAFIVAASLCWAIEPAHLEMLLAIANREGAGPEAVATKLGRKLENTWGVEVREGVAVVPVHGPIFRRANLFTEVSGATSIEILARDFRAAVDDPAVHAIVLDIDSPGGEANGINEFAAMVRASRSTKPVCAYVGGMAASAAYWIASACGEIVADESAEVGSIGCVMAVTAPDATSAKQIEIVSSQSPFKRPNVATKEGRSQYQKRVDDHAEIFVANVATNRAVTVEAVLEKFGRGGVMTAKSAIAVGMLDTLGSLEGTIARLAGDAPPGRASSPVRVLPAAAVVASAPPALNPSTAAPAASPAQRTPMAAIALVTLAALVGLSATASEEEVTSTIASQRKTREELHKSTGKPTDSEAFGAIEAMKENTTQLKVVREELAQLKADARENEVRSILEANQKSGKLPPARVAWALGIAGADAKTGLGGDPAKLRALVDGLEVAVATSPVTTASRDQAAAGAGTPPALTSEELTICSQLKIDPKQFAADKAAEIARA